MRFRSYRGAGLLAALVAAPALASDGDLAACRGVDNDIARLACYDSIGTPAPMESAPPQAAAPPPPQQAAPSQQQFGAEALPQQKKPKEPKTLRARLVGKLDGWRNGTRFKLDNGQVWQSVDSEEGYETVDGDVIIIERNFIGTYWMHFEKAHGTLRVKRVQ
jgi:hypothetical protein